mgnify:CR=1 FL=1
MTYLDSQDAVWDRLAGVVAQVRRALEAGLEIARSVHEKYGWRPEADRHLPAHLVRREVLERVRDLNPTLEDTDGLGLPMSGIRIEPTRRDVVRIWRSPDGELPAPRSDSIRTFYTQARSDQEALPGLFPDDLFSGGGENLQPNNLALLWWDDDGALSRLCLVRPCGVHQNRGVAEWTVDALAQQLPGGPPTSA